MQYKKRMKKTLLLILLFVIFSCKMTKNNGKILTENSNEIQIEFNKNIETIGIILNLSFVGDFILERSRKGRNYEFIRLVRKEFEKYKNHKAVKEFNNIKDNKLAIFGHYYYGLTFSELPEMKQFYPRFDEFYSNKNLDRKEIDSILSNFDKSVREFYVDAELDKFFIKNKDIYATVIKETQNALPKNIISTMEKYFKNYKNEYVIVPSLTIPVGWNFGPKMEFENKKIFYYVAGPADDMNPIRNSFKEIVQTDSLGFENSKYYRELAIHEFGHSFVRFIDNNKNKELWQSLSYLNNKELKNNFKKIGGGTEWSTIFEEHLVRANEIMIWRELGNNKMANEKLEYEYGKEGILYIKEFVNSLENYRINKGKYHNFEEYFPKLISDLKKNIKNQ